jgi:uncharacterized protein YodC (DUF2158 family)
MSSRFKVGDTVQLKSGGPKMTVTDVGGADTHVGTVWFAGAKRERANFPVDALKAVLEIEEPKKK